jgi:hypothetical protein
LNNVAGMDREDVLHRIEHEFGLPRETVFFLHLVPLLEVLWADGKSQEAERALVYDYSMNLQRAWAKEAGTEVVSDQALHDFFTRFLHQRPDAATLRGLRDLLLALPIRADSAPELSLDTVLDYCLDIAASAVTHYPYGLHDRVTAPEKTLIKELVRQIGAAQVSVSG